MTSLPECALLLGESGNSPAPRLFKCDETVFAKDLPEPADKSIVVTDGFDLCFKADFDGKLPDGLGLVVGVVQMKRGGSGFIRVRWGEIHEQGTIYAEFHFSGNPSIPNSPESGFD